MRSLSNLTKSKASRRTRKQWPVCSSREALISRESTSSLRITNLSRSSLPQVPDHAGLLRSPSS